MDYLYYLFIILAFIAVVLLLEGIYFLWSANKSPEVVRIEKRLQSFSTGWHGLEDNIIKERFLSESPGLQKILLLIPRIHSLDKVLLQSGLQWNVSTFLMYTVFAGLCGLIFAFITNLPFIFVLLSVTIASVVPLLIVLNARRKRLLKIEEQLPDAIDLMARALRAGHAFSGTLLIVADEASDPLASEFRVTFDEVNYGIAMQDALMNLIKRIPITDLRYLVIAILIQRESGGNLAELLTNIGSIIRARLKLLATIRVLSAEGRLSAWILGSLPFAVAFMIQIANPGYLNILFTDPLGHAFIAGASVMMIIGILVMWRIIKIRV